MGLRWRIYFLSNMSIVIRAATFSLLASTVLLPAAATTKGVIEILKAVVRPFLAISCWAATIGFLGAGMSVPDAWWALVAAVSTFYFVHRHQEKKAGSA